MTEVTSEQITLSNKNLNTNASNSIGSISTDINNLEPKSKDPFQQLTAWGCLQYNLENQHEPRMDTAEPQNKEQSGHNSSEQPSPPSSSSSDSSSGNGSTSSSGNSPISSSTGGNNLKPKRLQVPKACMNCRKKKAGCDRERPCKRCIQSGEEASCVDVPRKKRGPLTINSSPSSPIVTTVTSIPSTPVSSTAPTKEIELLANLSNSSSANHMNTLYSKPKSNETVPLPNTPNSLLHTVTNNAGQSGSNLTTHSQPLNAPSSGGLEQLSKQQSLATTAPTSTSTETQLIANNLEKERAAKLLAYLVEKHNEQQLLSTFSMECTTHNHSELADAASDQVLIKDYIHAIFDKASKCNDWNLAVATVVSLVEEGVHLLNCYQPRQSLVYFTGFLEGILKYEPWVSCFQQMHQHVADVPYIVESFCAKLLEFDGILNEYEKEIIRTRLEPFRHRMDKSKPNYHDFIIVKAVSHNGHVNLPTPASQFMDPYDAIVTRKLVSQNNAPNHNGLHYTNATINHFQPPEHHAQPHSSTNNGKHPSKHMFL